MDNKGFSLVELIVVVLILGILATAAIVNISYYQSADTEACAKKVVTTLEKARLETMSRADGSVRMVIYVSGNNTLADIIEELPSGENVIESVKLCDEMISVSAYKYQDDLVNETGPIEVNESNKITINFDKGSGIYKPDVDGKYYSRIIVNGRDNLNIILVKDTGRSYVE